MCPLFLITLVDIKDKCKMCGSTDDGMNSSTCNWVNNAKLYIYMPHHFIATVGAM